MNSSTTTIDRVQERLAEAVRSSSQRTSDEQRRLLAAILADAFEATRSSVR